MKPKQAIEQSAGREDMPDDFGGLQIGSPKPTGLSASHLLTADQLSDRWQVPRQHVYRLSRSGQIPVVRLGRYFRYRLDAIEAWEKGQENV